VYVVLAQIILIEHHVSTNEEKFSKICDLRIPEKNDHLAVMVFLGTHICIEYCNSMKILQNQ
jgi:hypothetical protein